MCGGSMDYEDYLAVEGQLNSPVIFSGDKMLHSHRLLSHLPLTPPSSSNHHRLPPLPRFLPAASIKRSAAVQAAALPPLPSPPATDDGTGPIELYPSPPSILAVDDNPSPIQVATSVLLTGAISVFLFRSLRRRAKRAKDLRVRSTGMTAQKDIKQEALERMRELGVAPVEAGAPPSPVQALLGSIAAGLIAIILYKFTTTIEASLNRQTISDNFSVRQITVTVRTIINGICYLATFVFGINSLGLFLYTIQLVVNSLLGIEKEEAQANIKNPEVSSTDTVKSDTVESKGFDIQDRSDDA